MKIDKEVLEKNKKGFRVLSNSRETIHRSMVIQRICELESDLCEKIAEFFTLRNSSITKEKVMKDLYSENGLLSSLSKSAKIAYYLGFIDDDIRHDLSKLAKLRNSYAHEKHRKQLQDEPDLLKLMHDSILYRKNKPELDALSPQHLFLSIQETLQKKVGAIDINA
jgi:DNA-binding MltR family transcriptional regulator